MFLSRRILNFGFRTTLKHLQDNATNMKNLRYPILSIQHNNFSVSKSLLSEDIKHEQSVGNDESGEPANKQPLGKIQGKLHLGFTCKRCNTRNNKIISKIAYEKGIVIARCEGCKNNHLIADNLGWFEGIPGHMRNIEYLLKKNGENVRRIRNDTDGYFEAVVEEEISKIEAQMKNQEAPTENVQPVEEVEEVVQVKYEKVGQSNTQ